MNRADFDEAILELHDCFGNKLNDRQMAIWFKHISTRGYNFSDLSKAVEKLAATAPRFPALEAVIKACQEQQSRRLEIEDARKKKEEEQPFQALLSDGTPISKLAPLVVRALKGDEEAAKELAPMGWK